MAQAVEPQTHVRPSVRDFSAPITTTILREARRSANRSRSSVVVELRCECTRPTCRATIPAVAEAHRGRPDRFIVLPDHAGGDTVRAVADRYFVVEPPRSTVS